LLFRDNNYGNYNYDDNYNPFLMTMKTMYT